jgi:molybdopterin synthase catalytic subunit
MRIKLTNELIAHEEMVENCRTKSAGAIVLFLGTVREITGNEQTLFLEYEAFAPLAEKTLIEIAEEATSKWGIQKIEIIHRLGILHPGETSIAVCVSCPHRADAFAACQQIMNKIKEVVPIWKKETSPKGVSNWIHPKN